MKKLTVVVTTYNQEKFITQALDSFVNQETNFPFEVLVCDDNSTDNTKKILEEYAEKYKDIIRPIYNKENKGPMENFIFTLSQVQSEYVALCDGDDYWSDMQKLQKQVDFLENNKEYSICFHRTKIFFEDSDNEDQIYPSNIPETTNILDLIKLGNYIPANTVVYRWKYKNGKKIENEFPKNIVPGDYYLHLIHAKEGKIKYIDEVMSHYRRHQSGMWWLTATPEGREQFHLKYGKKYINFYNAIEKNLQIDRENTKIFIKDIMINTIISFVKNNRIKELDDIRDSENNGELYSECMLELINRSNLYISYLIEKENIDREIEMQKQELVKEKENVEKQKQELEERYYRLNKVQKIIYLLFIDKEKREQEIKERKDRYKIKKNKE